MIYDQQEEIENISWNVSGKIVSLTRIVGSQKADLEFEYDAMGNRIVKRVIPKNPDGTKNMTAIKTTYYVRDAQSNIMASYTQTNTQEIALEEQPIYGSSRLGVYHPTTETGIVRGNRIYEGSNHLGNVLVTFSDRIVFENGDLKPATVSYSDYYAFGMPIKTRTNAARLYKSGFNGQMKDDEIYGEGNTYSAQYWEYDARIGRRWNVDPVDQISISNYAVMGNNPIANIDPNGDEWDTDSDKKRASSIDSWLSSKEKQYSRQENRNRVASNITNKLGMKKVSNFFSNKANIAEEGKNEMAKARSELQTMGTVEQRFTFIDNYTDSKTYMNSNNVIVMQVQSQATTIHELKHGYQHLFGNITLIAGEDGGYNVDIKDEIQAYYRQAVYNFESVNGLSIIKIKNASEITSEWVRKITSDIYKKLPENEDNRENSPASILNELINMPINDIIIPNSYDKV